MGRLEQFKRVLESLVAGSPEIEGTAILSEDGLIIASNLPNGFDEMRISAASAAMFGASTNTASEFNRGGVEELILRGAQGYAILSCAARGTVLVVLAAKSAKLGGLLLGVREAVSDLNKALG